MVVWRDYPLQCQNNFIIIKISHSVCRYTIENTMPFHHKQQIVKALQVNSCLVTVTQNTQIHRAGKRTVLYRYSR